MARPIPMFPDVFGPSQDEFPALLKGSPAMFGLPTVLLDGGMGTTLEDDFSQNITNSPLWSARLIQNDPAVLGRLHQAFLRAGSQIVSTSTYQASFETYGRAGYSEADAVKLMQASVKIADDARRASMKDVNDAASATTASSPSSSSSARHRSDRKVCLSLGPFGAMLPYAQEFGAIYPPPFGPCAFDPENNTSTGQTNSFIAPPTPTHSEEDDTSTPTSSAIPPDELASHQALTDFHLRRLRVFAQDDETWSRIDLVAFETTPLLREARAIREAVARLQSEMMHDRSSEESTTSSWTMKPWYISFVFPGGRFPEERWTGGPKYDVPAVIRSVFLATPAVGDSPPTQSTSTWAASTNIPSGIGINCTEPKYIPQLIKEMSEALRTLLDEGHLRSEGAALPWLVVYPNGGTQYDIIHRTWIDQSSSPADQWANDVLKAIESGVAVSSSEGEKDERTSDLINSRAPWGGILIGGCCKASPAHIAALARRLYPVEGASLGDRAG